MESLAEVISALLESVNGALELQEDGLAGLLADALERVLHVDEHLVAVLVDALATSVCRTAQPLPAAVAKIDLMESFDMTGEKTMSASCSIPSRDMKPLATKRLLYFESIP